MTCDIQRLRLLLSKIARDPAAGTTRSNVWVGCDPDDPDTDPIIEANALRDVGRVAEARRTLLRLLEQDPQ